MKQPKRSGRFFFILGGSVLGMIVLGSIINSASQSSSSHSAPVLASVPEPVKAIAKTQMEKPVPVIKEPNPPSDNYVPPYVKLTSPISLPVIENGVQTGIRSVPIGTKVDLNKIKGIDVEITYDGQSKKIPNISTDLLPRMLGTADD